MADRRMRRLCEARRTIDHKRRETAAAGMAFAVASCGKRFTIWRMKSGPAWRVKWHDA